MRKFILRRLLAVARAPAVSSLLANLRRGDEVGWIARRTFILSILMLMITAGVTMAADLLPPGIGHAAQPLLAGVLLLMLTFTTLQLVNGLIMAEKSLQLAADSAARASEVAHTAKERAELAKERFAMALRVGKIGYWFTDLSTGQIGRSETLKGIYGFLDGEPEPPPGGWKKLVHPEDREWVYAARDRLGPDFPQYSRSHRIIRPVDGEIRHLSVTVRWFPGGSTGAGHLVGMVTDITGWVVATQEAERANLAKSRLISSIGHDVRQPLQGLTLHLDGLSSYIESIQAAPAKARRAVDACLSSVAALSRMLDGVLVGGLEGSGLELVRPTAVSVAEVCRDLAKEYRSRAIAANLTLQIHFHSAAQLMCVTDPLILERIARNLIDNAIKYTHRGGRVLITARRRSYGVLFEVRDTGRGIAPADLDGIWENMRQLSPSDSGQGLGLATVRRLAQRLHCQIGVTSALGRGTRFWVQIPKNAFIAKADGLDVQEAQGEAGPDLRDGPAGEALSSQAVPPMVILVEDDDAIRIGIARLLQGWGIDVAEAASVREAYEVGNALLAQGRRPDLVITDYRLPDQPGTRVVDWAHGTFGLSLPCVVLTADTGPELAGWAARAAIPILRKPATARQLRGVLDAARIPAFGKIHSP